MLKIRKEQMAVFSDHILRQFEDEMVAHLRSNFRDQTREIPEEQVREMVNSGIETAERYGITQVFDVQRYLQCMVLIGPQFDKHPLTAWAGDILRRDDLNGRAKMDEIEERMIFGSTKAV